MVVGVCTSCQYCGTPLRSCVLPAVCWACDSPEKQYFRKEVSRLYEEALRLALAAAAYRRSPDYQI